MFNLKDPKVVIALGLCAAGLVFVLSSQIKGILKSINPFADSKEEAQGEKDNVVLSAKDYFSPQYKLKFKSIVGINDAKRKQLAKEIWDAKGTWLGTDSEERAVGVFRQLGYKTQVSQLAAEFWNQYQRDLYGFLQSFFSNTPEKFTEIKNIVEDLPSGEVNPKTNKPV